ncbi:MAG TPA: iron-containing redox enzyme family protein [Burkholderiales bacterium]
MPFHEELQGRTARERAELLAAPAIAECLAGRVTRARYVGFLRQAYHHVRHTVPLLEACARRLGEERAALRDAIAHYIAEETGHEQWILDDLRACGDDPNDARRAPPALATELMVAYVYDYIARIHPAGFFGMVHVLEGTSSALATRAAQSIAGALGLPRSAFTYLTSHGALDQEHVRFFADTVDAMTREEQEHVVHVAQRVYRLYGDIFRGLPS